MECNKDEAVRAKEIAEQKMESGDFERAKKFALKAQNLYRELENISQMLTTCNVHCSARNKIMGIETDWYGILQVDKFADELVVKKQYRKLALILHPDKNRFPGAEGAFKLICSANALLLDAKQKLEYDVKIKTLLQNTRLPNKTQQYSWQASGQTRASNGFSNTNQNQALNLDTFWTSCPACKVRYKYLRKFLNSYLRCQSCKMTFMGCELSTGGASVGAKMGQASTQHVPPRPAANQAAVNESVGVGKTSEANAVDSDKNVEKPSGGSEGVGVANVEKASGGSEGVGVANPTRASGDSDDKDKDVRNMNDKSKMRTGKSVIESSESSDGETDEDIPTNQKSEPIQVRSTRRSSRLRNHVLYNEIDEDYFAGPVKKRRYTESGNEKESNDTTVKSENVEEETVEQKDDVSNNEDEAGGKTGADVEVNIPSDFSLSDDDTTDDVRHCPDPEFSDFDREREESRFKVGQFWACYDTFDGMPRFYAKVKSIRASPFELTFTWLEANPIHEAQIKWAEDLPVGCGRFELGETEKTSSLPTFSHQMHCEKGKKRNTLVIYPREGEVWALFKDWDMSWSLNPENHQQFQYEVVEVLSNFDERAGIRVIHMNKINGFVSLFQRTSPVDARSFMIQPHELYRFSHRVLCNKLTGRERAGVPPNSYELDPASLPTNLDDLHYPYNPVIAENLETDSQVKEEGKPGRSTHRNNTPCRETVVDVQEINRETFERRRSPRGLKGEKAK